VSIFRKAAGNKAELSVVRELQGKMEAISRSQAVIEFNLDGTIITANQNFLDAMGYSLVEIEGRHHSTFVDPVDVKHQDYQDFWRDLNRGEFAARKFRRLAKGGREIWLQASYNPVLDEAGKPFKIIKLAVDITAMEQTAQRSEAERVVAEQIQNDVVSALAAGLRRLADGDLTTRIDADFTGAYAAIKQDFDRAMGSLGEAMGAIAASTDNMRGGSDEIASASDDLSQRTEQTAANLEETAAALDQITATVKRSAEGAKQAANAASGAKTDAERSGEVVREAVSAMGEIEQSSDKISQIIGVIDEIAFQTNLLALNAGVEAARAGDAGRGFAVVAQEVRALAQRSAEAAKEIKALISSSTAQVGRGVKLVGETGEALMAIVGKVGQIDILIAEIALSAQEQATGLNQVNSAVNQMDQTTQQNAAMVEEATAAASNLRSESVELARLVARFKIDEAAVTRRIEVAKPGRHAPTPSPVARDRARLYASFGGGKAATAANEWEEF
jgi:methyl-accepting chemotaxis protein